MWNPFDRRSPRDKALAEIAKRLGRMEEIVEGDAEDSEIEGIMHRLARMERLLLEETQPEPAKATNLGEVAINILSELIPPQFRGMAQGPIREFFSNPANVELAKTKLIELSQALNKEKNPTQPATQTPQQPQPLAPPGINWGQSYRPQQPGG